MKRTCILILQLMISIGCWADWLVTIDGITYDVYENVLGSGAAVSNNPNAAGEITIPASIKYKGKTYKVTNIGHSAFKGCIGLTSITIQASINSIYNFAFSGCSGLTSITIPNSVIEIGKNAFSGCSGLTSITIPNRVSVIGDDAFIGCSGLASIVVESGNTIYDSRYECNAIIKTESNTLLSGCKNTVIPNDVSSIGNYAFYNCKGLTSITIPSSVTSVGSNAFEGCSDLISVTINSNAVASKTYSSSSSFANIFGTQVKNYVFGDDVQSIGEYACYKCSSLTSVTIPSSVTSIGSYAFCGCSEQTNVTIPSSVTLIGDYAFSGCSSLTSVTINSNAVASKTYSSSSSFANIFGTQVKNYVFGDDVQNIGAYACCGCNGLISVTIPNSIVSIGSYAFKGCSSMTKAEFANTESLCGIQFGSYASNPLSYAHHLYIDDEEVTDLVIPNSVTEICDYAFCGCNGLISVTFPNSLTSIGGYAFDGLSGLKSVTIPNSVTSIGSYAFNGCSGLTKAEFASVESLCGIQFGSYASNPLYYAHHLYIDGKEVTDLVIPKNVTTIGDYVFRSCNGLTSIVVESGNTKYDSRNDCNAIIETESNKLVLGCKNTITPNNVNSIGNYAFYNCKGLTSITIPSSVTLIGDCALSGCGDLASVTINSNDITSKTYSSSSSLAKIFGTQVKDYVFGNDIESIGEYACYGCGNLTSVTIGNSVTEIGKNAFEGCSGLISVTINSNDITSKTYSSLSSLAKIFGTQVKNYVFGDDVQSIGAYACYGCSNLTSVTIPKRVSEIGNDVFKGCSGLVSIVVESGNTKYDSRNDCNAIIETESNKLVLGCKNTIIPNSVILIGNNAFYNCNGLGSITIPYSVTSIDNSAFYGCSGLTSVTINSNAVASKTYSSSSPLAKIFGTQVKNYVFGDEVQSIGAYACYGCGSLTSVTIGNNVTSIGNSAFNGCSGLASVTIGNSVTSIGNSAFNGCSGLASVTIGNSVTSIGSYAFNGCSGLDSVTFGNSETSIGYSAFEGCSGLTKTEFASVESLCAMKFSGSASNPLSYAHHLYIGAKEVKDLVIPNSVTSIGQFAFFGCNRLTSVTMGNSVTSIGNYAFEGCSGLASIVVESGNTKFDSRNDCNAIIETESNKLVLGCKNTIIPNSVILIGNNAFYNCSGLASVTIPNSVNSIGYSAFEGCNMLTSVTINSNAVASKTYSSSSSLAKIFGTQVKNYVFGDEVRSIGAYACYGCSNLTSVTIPNSVTSFGSDAFEGCSGLIKAEFASVESLCGMKFSGSASNPLSYAHHLYIDGKEISDLVIPNSVSKIGNYAFEGCSGLTTVIIPESITNIGSSAFSNCSRLTSVTINSPYVGSWFQGLTSIKYFSLGKSVLSIGDNAFYNCSNAIELTILTNHLTSIGDYAFEGCNNMSIFVNKGSETLLAVWAKEIVPYDITTKERLDASSTIVVQEQMATAVTAKLDELFVGYDCQLFINGNPMKRTETFMQTGLDPDTEYTISGTIALVNQDEETILSCALPGRISVATSSLIFETLQPKVVTEGNVVVESISNIQYDEEKVGVEWRRTDWTDDFPSNSATAYLYEGTIQGYIRNLNTNYLWKFRPYYETAAGNRYYGDWMGVDPTNTSYFEPTVHTYAVKIVEGNQVQVKGYALTGTDKVTSQGFAYWKVSVNAKTEMSNTPAKALSVPDDAMTVTAKGTVMEANLTGLEYNATYCYVAYVTTSEGETYYGEQQSFTTGDDLTPVKSIEASQDTVTIEAIYDASGRKQTKMQRGLNILRMSDGTTRKVLKK